MPGQFYVMVMQATLIFVSDTWVVTPIVVRTLGRIPPLGGVANHGEDPKATAE